MSDRPDLMLVAIYELPDTKARVCLGIRIGKPEQIVKYQRLLVLQVRDRYPEFFAGMKPKQVEAALDLDVYDVKPDKRGFPKWLGGAGWWK